MNTLTWSDNDDGDDDETEDEQNDEDWDDDATPVPAVAVVASQLLAPQHNHLLSSFTRNWTDSENAIKNLHAKIELNHDTVIHLFICHKNAQDQRREHSMDDWDQQGINTLVVTVDVQ